MKIRSGFVSNSSSSSFVIAVKKNNVCPTCHRADINFLNRFTNEESDYESSRLLAEEVEEIIDALKKNYGSDFEEVIGKEDLIRSIFKSYEDNGYEIGYIRISYDDEGLNNELRSLKNSKQLIVLHDLN